MLMQSFMVSSSLNLKKIISKHFVKCWDGKKILEQIIVEHTAYNLSGSSNGSSWSTLLFMSGVNSPVSFAPFSLFFAAGLFGLVTLDFRRFFCSYKLNNRCQIMAIWKWIQTSLLQRISDSLLEMVPEILHKIVYLDY